MVSRIAKIQSVNIFSTKLLKPFTTKLNAKAVIPQLKRMLVASTMVSCLWYNTSLCPNSGRRKPDFLSPKSREKASKVLVAFWLYLVDNKINMDKEENGAYKNILVKLIAETILMDKALVPPTDYHFQRVSRIISKLTEDMNANDKPVVYMLSNQKKPPDHPEYEDTASLARHIVLDMETVQHCSDSQIAFIVAHEMAHHALDHHAETLSWLCIKYSMLVILLLYTVVRRRVMLAIIWIVLEPFHLLVYLPVKRQTELEADDLGMDTIALYGYDAEEAMNVWTVVPQDPGASAVVFAHPSHEQRRRRMEGRINATVKMREEAMQASTI